MNYRLELKKGILLNDYNIFIEWGMSIQDFLKKIGTIGDVEKTKNDEFSVATYAIKSKVLDLEDEITLSFSFVKGNMVSINFGKIAKNDNIEANFNATQCFLESKFGKPGLLSTVTSNIINSKGEHTYKWKIGQATIVHSIYNNFGLVESLEIIVK